MGEREGKQEGVWKGRMWGKERRGRRKCGFREREGKEDGNEVFLGQIRTRGILSTLTTVAGNGTQQTNFKEPFLPCGKQLNFFKKQLLVQLQPLWDSCFLICGKIPHIEGKGRSLVVGE